MNTSDNVAPVQARWRAAASRAQTGVFRAVWVVGAAAVTASVLLIVGAFAADSTAGESWQPAGVLGAIGLCLGVMLIIVGLVARSVAAEPGHRCARGARRR